LKLALKYDLCNM